MKDPDRRIKSSGSEVERLLLRAGANKRRGEQSGARSRRRRVWSPPPRSPREMRRGLRSRGRRALSATTLLSLKWIVVVGVASAGW